MVHVYSVIDTLSYTIVVRRDRYIELYEKSKGNWQSRDVPDVLLEPETVEVLAELLPFASQQRILINLHHLVKQLHALDEMYNAISSFIREPLLVKKYEQEIKQLEEQYSGCSIERLESDNHGMIHVLVPRIPLPE